MSRTICDRIEASIKRVLHADFPIDFSCSEADGVVTLLGTARSKDDATTCGVVARMVPGVRTVINTVKADQPGSDSV